MSLIEVVFTREECIFCIILQVNSAVSRSERLHYLFARSIWNVCLISLSVICLRLLYYFFIHQHVACLGHFVPLREGKEVYLELFGRLSRLL